MILLKLKTFVNSFRAIFAVLPGYKEGKSTTLWLEEKYISGRGTVGQSRLFSRQLVSENTAHGPQ